jgi:hypothetical protein
MKPRNKKKGNSYVQPVTDEIGKILDEELDLRIR